MGASFAKILRSILRRERDGALTERAWLEDNSISGRHEECSPDVRGRGSHEECSSGVAGRHEVCSSDVRGSNRGRDEECSSVGSKEVGQTSPLEPEPEKVVSGLAGQALVNATNTEEISMDVRVEDVSGDGQSPVLIRDNLSPVLNLRGGQPQGFILNRRFMFIGGQRVWLTTNDSGYQNSSSTISDLRLNTPNNISLSLTNVSGFSPDLASTPVEDIGNLIETGYQSDLRQSLAGGSSGSGSARGCDAAEGN